MSDISEAARALLDANEAAEQATADRLFPLAVRLLTSIGIEIARDCSPEARQTVTGHALTIAYCAGEIATAGNPPEPKGDIR